MWIFYLPLISYASLTVGNAFSFVSVYFSNMFIYYGEELIKEFVFFSCLGFWTWQPIVHCSHCCILSLPLGSSHKQPPRPKSPSSKKRPQTVPSGRLSRLASKHTIASANKRVAGAAPVVTSSEEVVVVKDMRELRSTAWNKLVQVLGLLIKCMKRGKLFVICCIGLKGICIFKITAISWMGAKVIPPPSQIHYQYSFCRAMPEDQTFPWHD